jgi:molecular chaperone IbpA
LPTRGATVAYEEDKMMASLYVKDPFMTFGQDIDRMFNAPLQKTNYPPYNVRKVDDEHFVMEFAVAGFKKEDISISVEKSILTVKGELAEDNEAEYLYKGIAGRKFVRSFSLPEFFEVERAGMSDGILYVDLYKDVPEEKKPKNITIE